MKFVLVICIIVLSLALVHSRSIHSESLQEFEQDSVLEILSDESLSRLPKGKHPENNGKNGLINRKYLCNLCGLCIGNPFKKDCRNMCKPCKTIRANPDIIVLPNSDSEFNLGSKFAELIKKTRQASWKPKETWHCGQCGFCYIADMTTCDEMCKLCSKPFADDEFRWNMVNHPCAQKCQNYRKCKLSGCARPANCHCHHFLDDVDETIEINNNQHKANLVKCSHRCGNFYWCLLRNRFDVQRCMNMIPMENCECGWNPVSNEKNVKAKEAVEKARCSRICGKYFTCKMNPKNHFYPCKTKGCGCKQLLTDSNFFISKPEFETKSSIDVVRTTCSTACKIYFNCIDQGNTNCKIDANNCLCLRPVKEKVIG